MTIARQAFAAGLGCALWATPGLALPAEELAPPVDLSSLSLEALGNLQVTSVSRKAERFNDTAAAVFVITGEDIRRSGATSIPEALRMVPGVQVTRMGNDRWAISARGFNDLYANKLLVQVDGRSIYTQLFSGVDWGLQDAVLEDIDRIEVIRGPGAALWGANAVNGVINIITKRAGETQGGLLQAGAGNREKGFGTLRYGGQAGDDTQYRLYAKAYTRAESVNLNGVGAGDSSRSRHAGFRVDSRLAMGDRVMLSGDIYEFDAAYPTLQPSLFAPYVAATQVSSANRGTSLLGRYDHTLQDGSEAALKFSVSSTYKADNPFFYEHNDIVDLDFQHRLPLGARHDLIWGLNYNYSLERITTPTSYEQIVPEQNSYRRVSVFVHDEITLLPGRLRAIVGTRIERNSYTGTSPQPNLRLVWTPAAGQTVWAAWSRAVRTPSLSERLLSIDLVVLPPFGVAQGSSTSYPFPLLLRSTYLGSNIGPEKLTAFELGYRTQINPRLALDLTGFANHYTDVRSLLAGNGTAVFSPILYGLVPIYPTNSLAGHSGGLEASLDWRPLDRWRLQASYSMLRMAFPTVASDPLSISPTIARQLNGQAPKNQFSLRSMLDVAPGHQLDLWLRHVATVPESGVPGYTTLDVRYGWRFNKHLELSLVGQNLLKAAHPEFLTGGGTTPLLQAQRGAYARLTWKF